MHFLTDDLFFPSFSLFPTVFLCPFSHSRMIQPASATEDISTPLVLSTSFQRLAMEKYIEGIQLEKQGSLSQGNPHCVPILQVFHRLIFFLPLLKALTCFQQAFKLDPDVDVTFSYQNRRKSSSSSSCCSKDVEEEEGAGHVTTITVSPALSIDELIDSICQDMDVSYMPLRKSRPVWISKLPGTNTFSPFPFDLTSLFYAHLCLGR